MRRRLVNLVTRNWTKGVSSVRRIDPYRHFFYGSAEAALRAAAEKTEPFPAMQIKDLPTPCMNVAATSPGGTLDMFALLAPRAATGEGRIVYANTIGRAALYDADRHVLHPDLDSLRTPKGVRPICLSIAHPGADDDSMYVLDACPMEGAQRCFEVLEPAPAVFRSSSLMPPWCSRLLPPPPFVRRPESSSSLGREPILRQARWYQQSCITSFTTTVDGHGCSTIYISCGGGVGTYGFQTARPDSRHPLGWVLSDKWNHVGEWMLPFHGRALYVSEFNLWFGFSALGPCHHLCATDLSAMDDGRQPAAPTVWEDLNPPAEGEPWLPKELELIHLGGGKFLIAKTFSEGERGDVFCVLTGVEMMATAGDDRQQTLQMIKHKCARFVFTDEDIQWVL